MGYTKKFNPERYWHISDALEKIELLEEGEKIVFFDLSPEEQLEIKWSLYDYFHHKKITQNFHLYLAEGFLTVRRKKRIKMKFFAVENQENPFEDTFRESLQYFPEEKAREFFIKKVPSALINKLLGRWREVML